MIRIKVHDSAEAARVLADIKLTVASHPGDHGVILEAGGRALKLGPFWLVKNSNRALQELGRYGEVTVE